MSRLTLGALRISEEASKQVGEQANHSAKEVCVGVRKHAFIAVASQTQT